MQLNLVAIAMPSVFKNIFDVVLLDEFMLRWVQFQTGLE